jgi:hypothetical protein
MFFRMCGRIRTSQKAAVRRLVRIEHFLAEGSKRGNSVAETAISAVAACAATAISARTSVSGPGAGEVVLVVRLIRILRIGGSDPALSALREKDSRHYKPTA